LNQTPFESRPYQPVEAGPTPRPSHLGRILGIVAALLVVVLAAGGYLAAGFVTAASDRQAAQAVIEQARTDNNRISGLMKTVPTGPTSASSSPDLAKSKIAVDGIAANFDHDRGLVTADLPRLRQAAATLQSQSEGLLVAPERGSLDQERGRVGAVVTAFSAARDGFQIAGDQMRLVSSMLDAEIALDSVLQEQDPARALAAYPQAEGKLQQAVALSKAPNTPPQAGTLMAALATLAADFKQLLQAAQAHNLSAAQNAQAKVTTDTDALANFDQKGFDTFETNLFKPYQDRYDQALRQAGFTVTE
jgi:hypothetical protein